MENFPKPRFEPWQDLDYNGIFFHSMTTFRNFCAKLVQLRTCSIHVAHKPHAPWLHFTGSPPDSRRTWLFSDTASIVQNECYPRGAFLTILSIFFFRPYTFGHPPPFPHSTLPPFLLSRSVWPVYCIAVAHSPVSPSLAGHGRP